METFTTDIEEILQASARKHSHLCPRQVLGARIGLAGLEALSLTREDAAAKRILVIAETDGCFIDGLIAAAGVDFGHRTLRVEDHGKIAATFIAVSSGLALRISPRPDIRKNARTYAPEEANAYGAQRKGYQLMPTAQLLTIREVQLTQTVGHILSKPGLKAICSNCGEEIINEREILRNGLPLCRACAGMGYYTNSG